MAYLLDGLCLIQINKYNWWELYERYTSLTSSKTKNASQARAQPSLSQKGKVELLINCTFPDALFKPLDPWLLKRSFLSKPFRVCLDCSCECASHPTQTNSRYLRSGYCTRKSSVDLTAWAVTWAGHLSLDPGGRTGLDSGGLPKPVPPCGSEGIL